MRNVWPAQKRSSYSLPWESGAAQGEKFGCSVWPPHSGCVPVGAPKRPWPAVIQVCPPSSDFWQRSPSKVVLTSRPTLSYSPHAYTTFG